MAVVRTGQSPNHVRDIGPAAAVADRLSAMGTIGIPISAADGHALGAGPIERRTLTPDELAAREAASRPPAPRKEVPVAPPVALTPTVPCGTCLHAAVCRLRDSIPELGPEALARHDLADGLRVVFTGVRVECDHHLTTVAAPPSAPQAPRAPRAPRHEPKAEERVEKRERARRVLDAIERHGGDRRAAAIELGMAPQALSMVVKHAPRILAEAVA